MLACRKGFEGRLHRTGVGIVTVYNDQVSRCVDGFAPLVNRQKGQQCRVDVGRRGAEKCAHSNGGIDVFQLVRAVQPDFKSCSPGVPRSGVLPRFERPLNSIIHPVSHPPSEGGTCFCAIEYLLQSVQRGQGHQVLVRSMHHCSSCRCSQPSVQLLLALLDPFNPAKTF